tara:strand:- start:208 stop:456 length:249 start_codon:yes stop_codon:yes gene_type:complete
MQNKKNIEKLIFNFIKRKSNKIKISDMNSNFIENEIIDSIGFLELILYLEENYKIEIDFGNLDPSQYTSITKLANFIHNIVK